MTFYIYDPKGYSMPYSHDEWKKVHKQTEAEIVEENQQKDLRKKRKKKRKEEEFTLYRNLAQQDSPILAEQVMTKNVIGLYPNDSLSKAWKLIYKNRFRHIPILSKKDDKLVGIVSDRGLIHEVVDLEGAEGKVDGKNLRVKDVMVTNVLTARPSTEISYIAKIFIDERIGSMPIIDREDHLVGILTRSDILKTLVKLAPLHQLRI